ncbi:MAG TPA: hypothetical protein VEH57_09630 [Thermoplasmata archaeon]|nr:hypothetical protein [Thermoplasmata archaeon]
MRAREKLKFRVYAAVRGLVLSTELFRSRPDFFEPDVFIYVYPQFVDVNTSLNEGQVHLLPAEGRSAALHRFAGELRNGFARIAGEVGLEFTPDSPRFGGSHPVLLLDVPIGYHAVLVRREGD